MANPQAALDEAYKVWMQNFECEIAAVHGEEPPSKARWGLRTVFSKEPLLKTKLRKEASPSFSGRFAATQQELRMLMALLDKKSVPEFLAAAASFPEPPAKPVKPSPSDACTDEFGFPLVRAAEETAPRKHMTTQKASCQKYTGGNLSARLLLSERPRAA